MILATASKSSLFISKHWRMRILFDRCFGIFFLCAKMQTECTLLLSALTVDTGIICPSLFWQYSNFRGVFHDIGIFARSANAAISAELESSGFILLKYFLLISHLVFKINSTITAIKKVGRYLLVLGHF